MVIIESYGVIAGFGDTHLQINKSKWQNYLTRFFLKLIFTVSLIIRKNVDYSKVYICSQSNTEALYPYDWGFRWTYTSMFLMSDERRIFFTSKMVMEIWDVLLSKNQRNLVNTKTLNYCSCQVLVSYTGHTPYICITIWIFIFCFQGAGNKLGLAFLLKILFLG